MEKIVYKILAREVWNSAVSAGEFHGSPDDVRDGFIHLSTGDQLDGTAARHFKGVTDLVLVAFDTEHLGPALKWEPSRGGALFPHLYAPLPAAAALSVSAMPLGPDGVPRASGDNY
ncbi:MAG: DUF952 domain-containing protein [Hyphomicrobium sp.]|nr:DUF952 domain-containing protein [Hyphomicrobium sp.]